ncbi:DUF6509 family protein [Sporosarcina limicola]|uniref:Pullulanase n=1 Tax=Sporosarcina limicola TaxID=34101 RepID=A0A927MJS4_9BACL|nr:DUF6509 family protein [Sporosarcina limicola]MBE1554437.1 hypothetical protein [Sporosarcina limicola]
MEITEHSVDKMNDPTGILTGERYEFRLYLALDEEDDLYAEGGTGLRVILAIDEEQEQERIVSYNFFDRATEKIMDFELEEDEKVIVLDYCKTHRDK